RQLAGRLFLDVGAQNDAIGRRPLALLDLELVAEIAEALDAVLAALDHQRIEGIALVNPEFAANDLVAGGGVTSDVDPLNIDPRRWPDLDRQVHQMLFG